MDGWMDGWMMLTTAMLAIVHGTTSKGSNQQIGRGLFLEAIEMVISRDCQLGIPAYHWMRQQTPPLAVITQHKTLSLLPPHATDSILN